MVLSLLSDACDAVQSGFLKNLAPFLLKLVII
jgi:hypothetical protein